METLAPQSALSLSELASAQVPAVKPLARLGHISFINSLPFLVPVLNHLVDLPAEIVIGTPTELNVQYQNGKLDVGAMSSFHFLSSSNLLLVPGISISAEGPVGSVLLFSKRPVDDINGGTICVTASSASSVNLLKVLLFDQVKVNPSFVSVNSPDLSSHSGDAVLVIGDQALAVDADWSNKYHRYDLAEWWHKSYKLPFVFGLWAARGQWVRDNFDAFQKISTALVRARNIGLTTAFDAVLSQAAQKSGLDGARLRRYFLTELSFEFTDRHMEGLATYARLCRQYQLL